MCHSAGLDVYSVHLVDNSSQSSTQDGAWKVFTEQQLKYAMFWCLEWESSTLTATLSAPVNYPSINLSINPSIH